MTIARRKSGDALTSWEEVKRSWMTFGKDLLAFASLQIAWFIVWRALRHGRRETKQQHHVSTLGTENSALARDGKTFDSNERDTSEKSIADSAGHRHHDGLSLDNGEA
jgi:hypothetical protein